MLRESGLSYWRYYKKTFVTTYALNVKGVRFILLEILQEDICYNL